MSLIINNGSEGGNGGGSGKDGKYTYSPLISETWSNAGSGVNTYSYGMSMYNNILDIDNYDSFPQFIDYAFGYNNNNNQSVRFVYYHMKNEMCRAYETKFASVPSGISASTIGRYPHLYSKFFFNESEKCCIFIIGDNRAMRLVRFFQDSTNDAIQVVDSGTSGYNSNVINAIYLESSDTIYVLAYIYGNNPPVRLYKITNVCTTPIISQPLYTATDTEISTTSTMQAPVIKKGNKLLIPSGSLGNNAKFVEVDTNADVAVLCTKTDIDNFDDFRNFLGRFTISNSSTAPTYKFETYLFDTLRSYIYYNNSLYTNRTVSSLSLHNEYEMYECGKIDVQNNRWGFYKINNDKYIFKPNINMDTNGGYWYIWMEGKNLYLYYSSYIYKFPSDVIRKN